LGRKGSKSPVLDVYDDDDYYYYSKICGTISAIFTGNYNFEANKVEMITSIYDSMSDN
jgi:hypothetical protein